MPELLKNEAQELAISTINGPVILVSIPGSGKTTVCVRRIHHMIEEGIDPSSILMMTFSRAAAQDMRDRYASLFGKDSSITFCTIHSFCLAVLSKFTGYSSESVIAPASVQQFFFEQLKPRRDINDKFQFINDLLLDIGNMKDSMLSVEDFEPSCCSDKSLYEKLFEEYETFKHSVGKIDYDDMLLLAYREMRQNPECLSFLQERYRYVMVDEYQDTSEIQSKIIYLLCGKYRNLCVVGDDDQSIYRFRGARPEIMLGFSSVFKDAKVITNETNYRSGKNIVRGAESLIRNNRKRFNKTFRAQRDIDGRADVNVLPNREIEVTAVVKEIERLISEGNKANDIAILFRNNSQSAAFAESLLDLNIPVFSNEKIDSKYESFMFQDILSYHRLSAGTGTNFDIAQTINRPQRYLWGSQFYSNGFNKRAMMDIVVKTPMEQWKRESMMSRLDEYFLLVHLLEGKKPSEAIPKLWSCGYKKYIKEYAAFRNMDEESFKSIFDSYAADALKCGDSWEALERYAQAYNTRLREQTKDPEGVRLSTMHGSKGLEWNTVFVVDAVKGINPYVKSVTPEDLEEERRLFYVACTRAKDTLHICLYKMNGEKEVKPSPYVEEFSRAQIAAARSSAAAKPDNRTLKEKLLAKSGNRTD